MEMTTHAGMAFLVNVALSNLTTRATISSASSFTSNFKEFSIPVVSEQICENTFQSVERKWTIQFNVFCHLPCQGGRRNVEIHNATRMF